MSEVPIIGVLALACMVVGAYVLFDTAMKILIGSWNKFWGWVDEFWEWVDERHNRKDRRWWRY